MVTIIDDRSDVWKNAGNLVLVDKYNFFNYTGDVNALSTQSTIDTTQHEPNQARSNTLKKRTEEIVAHEKFENVENVSIENNLTTCEIAEFTKNATSTLKFEFNHHGSELEKTEETGEYRDMVEWEDSDGYLIHLQTILIRIHTAFYKSYDRHTMTIPHTKMIVPHVRKNILRGKNILFTGVEEISWAHMLAGELGATIQSAFIPPGNPASTTHVVAGRRDTEKVYRAALCRTVPIVTPKWLQACSERWERVDETHFLWRDCLKYFQTVKRPLQSANDETFSGKIQDSLKKVDPGMDGQEKDSNSRRISRKRELDGDSNPKVIKRSRLLDGDS